MIAAAAISLMGLTACGGGQTSEAPAETKEDVAVIVNTVRMVLTRNYTMPMCSMHARSSSYRRPTGSLPK